MPHLICHLKSLQLCCAEISAEWGKIPWHQDQIFSGKHALPLQLLHLSCEGGFGRNLTASDGATGTFPASQQTRWLKNTLHIIPAVQFTPHLRSQKKHTYVRGISMQTKCQCSHKCASMWEKEKGRNLGSLPLKKKADTNLFSAKTLEAMCQEAVFGASLLLCSEKWDFLCVLCTSKE